MKLFAAIFVLFTMIANLAVSIVPGGPEGICVAIDDKQSKQLDGKEDKKETKEMLPWKRPQSFEGFYVLSRRTGSLTTSIASPVIETHTPPPDAVC
jgi:hypothetical protein